MSRVFFMICLWLQACGGPMTGDTGSDGHLRGDTDRVRRTDTVNPAPADVSQNLAGDFAPASALRFDSIRLARFYKRYPACLPMKNDLRTFYRQRTYSFAWFDGQGLTEQAASMYDRILQLPTESPLAVVPYANTLDTLIDNAASLTPTRRLETELLLTSAYFYFAEKAWKGIDPSKIVQSAWFVPIKKADYGWWLHRYSAGTDPAVRLSEPVNKQYELLRNFLQRYRDLTNRERWPILKRAKGPDDTALFRQVRRRLVLLGDLEPSQAADTNTLPAVAIRRFQRRTGLTADGKLGPSTLRELNIPPTARLKQILVNMERNRWLNATPSGDYLAVNIPEFSLHVFRNDSHLWDMKVVVGRSIHKTAIFAGTLRNIVFSPYWNVPPGILYKEVLPGVARDRNYLARHHMERFGGGIRQKPGPWNALGGVKFLFPNSHNIYLHDSPEKNKFKETNRAFSHGCIRLAEPAKLAGWLLRSDPTWTSERIEAAMHAGNEKWVPAPGNVRVVILYLTAWVDAEGVLNFCRDIYRRDARLAAEILPERL